MSDIMDARTLPMSWIASAMVTMGLTAAQEKSGAELRAMASDEELLAMLKMGRREALDTLIDRHADAVFSCLRRRVRVPETAEDLFQETWIRVAERCGTYKSGVPVRPWLYRIALNVLTDHIRRENAARRGGGAEHVNLDDAIPHAAAPPATSAQETQERHILHRLVNELPELYREVVRLRYFEELSTQDVARVLGCPEGTIKSRLARGLSLLETEMEKYR